MIKKFFNYYATFAVVIATIIGLYLYSEFIYNKKIYLDEKMENLSLLYNTQLIANKKISEALFDDILTNNEILNLIYLANKSADKEPYRDRLYELLKEKYQRMSKKGILQFHFHLANGESFLRFHKLEKYGDSLLFRESIQKVIKTKKELYGFEIGKYFDGFRYIYPLFYENAYIGSVESSMNAEEIINQLQESSNNAYSLILNKQMTQNFINETHLNKYYSEFGRDKSFYINNTIHKNFHKSLKIRKHILEEFQFDNNFDTERSFVEEFDYEKGEKLIFIFLPIKDFKGKVAGYIFVAEKNIKIFNMFLMQLSKFVVALILLLLFIKYLKKSKELEQEKENNIQYNTIGKLSAGLSHEINTPVTIMNGNLEMLKSDIKALPETDNKAFMLEDVQSLENNLTRIKNITESMREIADIQEINIQEINLYRIIVVVLRLLHYKANNIQIRLQNQPFDLTLDLEHENFPVTADYKKLEQVFIAIFNNAIDQLEHYGDPKTNLIDIHIIQTDDYTQVDIHDNGGGIEEELLPNLFQPFKSNKTHQGLGIGLSVVKKIIDEHHFSIFAKNEKGGALFTIRCYR